MEKIKNLKDIDELLEKYWGWEIEFQVYWYTNLAYNEEDGWYEYSETSNGVRMVEDHIKNPELFYHDISELWTNSEMTIQAKNYKDDAAYGAYYCDDEFGYYGTIDEDFKEYVTEQYDLEGYLTHIYNTETYIDRYHKTIVIEYHEQE